MQVNEFTKRVLNKKLNGKAELINFIEERDLPNQERIFYHTDVRYKDSVIFACIGVDKNDKSDLEDMVKEIDSEIKEYEEMIEQGISKAIKYLLCTIECRYCDVVFNEGKENELRWSDWEMDLIVYLEKKQEELSKSHTAYEVYKECSNNFIKEVLGKQISAVV